MSRYETTNLQEAIDEGNQKYIDLSIAKGNAYGIATSAVQMGFLNDDKRKDKNLEDREFHLCLPVPFDTIVYTVDLNTCGEYEVFDWEFSSVNKNGYILTSQFSEIEVSVEEFKKKVYLEKEKAENALKMKKDKN